MNAITRVYNTSAMRLPLRNGQRVSWSWGTKCLIVLFILSAFAVVYLKDLNRRTYIQYQNMARANQQSQVDWENCCLSKARGLRRLMLQQTAE